MHVPSDRNLRRQYSFPSPQSYLNVLGSTSAWGSALAPVHHPAPEAQLILGFLNVRLQARLGSLCPI